jgi:hypothetical protein
MARVDCKQPQPADEHSRPAVFDKKRLFFKRNAACITDRDMGVPGDDDRLNPRFDLQRGLAILAAAIPFSRPASVATLND